MRLSLLISLYFLTGASLASADLRPWHEYSLDKLVNEQCQPKMVARVRFMYNKKNFWAAVSVAAENELEYHATGGGVAGYCASSTGSNLLSCQAYIKSYILRARNCYLLAKQQLKLLK